MMAVGRQTASIQLPGHSCCLAPLVWMCAERGLVKVSRCRKRWATGFLDALHEQTKQKIAFSNRKLMIYIITINA